MTNQQLKQLNELILIPSPSGFEFYIADYIKNQLLKYLPEGHIEIDFQKNVIVKIDGEDTSKTVMIDAHLDQIGFVVTNISKEGLLTINYLGGSDATILSARQLNIVTDYGIINAVVDRKHSHLVYDEDDEGIYDLADAQIDIGIRKFDVVSKHVKIGDPVVYKPHFYKLINDYYSGYGFDDKAGCSVLLNTIQKLAKSGKKPPTNLIFVFSSQEETNTKLFPVARKYKPDLVLSVDVTFATDYGLQEDLDRQAGRCELDGGSVIYRGLGLHEPGFKLLEDIAKKHKLKFQNQANADNAGYTSLMVAGELEGIKALVIGIPLRNMHTPVEIICLKDLMNSAKLLEHFVLSPNLSEIL